MTRLIVACLVLGFVMPAHAATTQSSAPYFRAIEIVRKLEAGPDEALVDTDAPLDARTAQFLARNQEIFDLLHAAVVDDRPEWCPTTSDMDALLHQLNPVRALASVGILRARFLIQQNQPSQAVDEILDVMALGRNVDRANPVMVTSLVAIGVEELAMSELAKTLPTLPRELVAALPDRLRALPPTTPFADLIRGEQKFGGGMLAQQLKAPDAQKAFDAMSPFYTTLEKASEETPPLSAADLKRKMSDAVSTIDKDQPVSRALAQNMVSSFVAFYSAWCMHITHRAMLEAGVVVVRDGPDAVKSSIDPFGDGPFELAKTAGGFELRSKLTDRADKPISMRFGK